MSQISCNCRFPVLIELHYLSIKTKPRLSRSPSSSSNTKFKDLKLQWLKYHIDMKVKIPHYLITHDMIADFFASPLIMRKIIMGTYSVSTG